MWKKLALVLCCVGSLLNGSSAWGISSQEYLSEQLVRKEAEIQHQERLLKELRFQIRRAERERGLALVTVSAGSLAVLFSLVRRNPEYYSAATHWLGIGGGVAAFVGMIELSLSSRELMFLERDLDIAQEKLNTRHEYAERLRDSLNSQR